MLGSAGAQSQVISSLGSEAVSFFNHFKNIAVSGCSSCYQQRQYSGGKIKHARNNLSKNSAEKDSVPVKNKSKENLTPSCEVLCHELGFHHLPENWTELVSLLAVEPTHLHSDSVWQRSYVSASSFYENKHGFSQQTSRNSSSSSWRLFHPHTTQLLRKYNRVNVSNTLVRHLHSMDRIKLLEEIANADRGDPHAQGLYLQAVLMKDPEFVIRRYESGLFASNDYCRRTYLRALELSGRVGVEEHSPQPPAPRQNPLHGSDEANPVIIKQLDDTKEAFTSEALATIKYILVRAFIALLLISTVEIGLDKWIRSPPDINKYEVLPENSKNIKFSDVRGASEAKQELVEIVEFLKDPKRFQYIGGRMPAGVLLTGPPGVGKTLLAKAVAGEAGVPFFYASGSNFEEMYVGVGAARIRKLFETAKLRSPSIIFIDEIDAIGGKRVPTDHQPYSNMTMNQLLTELDGFEKDNMVVVIAATNFAKSLDPALTRPGRFDTTVNVDPPFIAERKDILELYVSKIKVGKDVSIDRLARTTAGFTGADLANLVNQAALKAASDEEDVVHMKHFEYAKDKHLLGPRRVACVMSDEVKGKVAAYEAGRALIALKNSKSVPVYKGTIIPRGRTLGNVAKIPDDDQVSVNKQEISANIEFHLGGMAANEVCFGKDFVTSGSQADLTKATQYARRMVAELCMSDKVGYRTHKHNLKGVSDVHLQVIDEEVERILQECYERAKKVVSDNKVQHSRLTEALVKYETLSQEEMKLVMDGKAIEQSQL